MNKIINRESKRQPVMLIKRSEMAKFFKMPEAIDSMAHAFACLSSGECFVPKRYITSTRDESLTFLLKPAFNTAEQFLINLVSADSMKPFLN